MKKLTRHQWNIKAHFIALAIRKVPISRQYHIQDYINEAEHQEGFAYWDYFQTPQEAYEDFALYYEEVEDYDEVKRMAS